MAESNVIPTTITFDSLMKSGVIPAREKSGIERAFERLRESKDKGEFHAVEAMKGVRQVAETGAFGAILGAIHANAVTGLDMKVGAAPAAGQVQRTIPVDAALMALGFVGGVFLAAEPSGVGKTAMNASAAAAAVFMFRQTNDFMSKNIIKKNAAAGTLKANPNAGLPGVISKASFAGEGDGGWAPGSKSWRASMHGGASMGAEDPIVLAARNL